MNSSQLITNLSSITGAPCITTTWRRWVRASPTRLDLLPLVLVLDQHHRRLGVVEHVGDLVGGRCRVDPGRGTTGGHGGDIEYDPLRAVEPEHRDGLERLESQGDERLGRLPHLVGILPPRDLPPCAICLLGVIRRCGAELVAVRQHLAGDGFGRQGDSSLASVDQGTSCRRPATGRRGIRRGRLVPTSIRRRR